MNSPVGSMVNTLPAAAPELELEPTLALEDLGILRALKRRWIWTALTTVVVGGFATVYTLAQTPIYESRFRMIMGTGQSQALPAIPGLSTFANISTISRDQTTNITVLQSEPILAQALEQLNQRGDFPPLEIEAVRKNLKIQPVQNSDIITVIYTDPNPERATAFLNILEKIYLQYSLDERTAQARNSLKLIESQLPLIEQRLAASSQQLEDFRRQYGFPDPDAYAAALASTRTTFERSLRDTDVQIRQFQEQQQAIASQLQLSGGDPAQPIPSTVLSQNPEYLRLVGQLQQTESQLALDRLRFQEDSPQIQRLEATRQQLLGLIQRQIIASIGSTSITSRQVAAASVPLLSDSILTETSGTQFDSPTELAEEIQTQQEIQEATALTRASALEQNLTTQLLSVQVNAAVQEARRRALESAIQATLQSFEQLPPLQRRYADLLRQVNLDTTAITTLRQRQQDLQIAQAQEIPPWRVVETATVPTQPISPNVRRNIIFGFFAGAVLGVMVAVMIENLDPRVKTVAEAKSAAKLPLLGTIPRLPISRRHGTKQRTLKTFGPIVEAFRSLAFSIIYGGKSLHTLAITSSLPSEGKSTTSHQLALALAEFGKRVLLVDADMRRSTQFEILGIPNALGLSTILTGEKAWQDLLYTHPDQPKLDILVAGPQPINPLLLLGSPVMKLVLEEWQKAYDIVVIDTPPLTGIADTQAVAQQVDSTLLVVGLGVANFNSISRTLETLKRAEADLLGIVVNYVEGEEGGYSYYTKYYHQNVEAPVGNQKLLNN